MGDGGVQIFDGVILFSLYAPLPHLLSTSTVPQGAWWVPAIPPSLSLFHTPLFLHPSAYSFAPLSPPLPLPLPLPLPSSLLLPQTGPLYVVMDVQSLYVSGCLQTQRDSSISNSQVMRLKHLLLYFYIIHLLLILAQTHCLHHTGLKFTEICLLVS